MAIGPITMGQTRPSWVVTVLRSDNTALDITGATFTGCLFELGTGIRKTLTVGNYSITNAGSGVFTYVPVAGDVDTLGVWDFETLVTIGGGVYTITVPAIKITSRRAA